ncbi:MAG: hypothetical protein IJ493_02895 [Clostridia bacterium]|nr:hypothetical protein [Clostridia bacterium]
MDYTYETEEEEDYTPHRRFRPKKIIRFIFKLIAYTIILGTFAVLLGRMQLAKTPKDFREFTWTSTALEAYAADPQNFTVNLQEPYTNMDEDGWYKATEVALCESAGEVQVTFRYNSRSTINTLMEKYGLTERPSGETFVFMLRDGSGKVYTEYTFAETSRPLYEFRRIVFTGVNFTALESLYLDVFYGEDVSENAKMNYTFVVYDNEKSVLPYKIGNSNKIKETELTFRSNPAYINRLDEE